MKAVRAMNRHAPGARLLGVMPNPKAPPRRNGD